MDFFDKDRHPPDSLLWQICQCLAALEHPRVRWGWFSIIMVYGVSFSVVAIAIDRTVQSMRSDPQERPAIAPPKQTPKTVDFSE